MAPLKMIISETIGSRAQVDLIDYTQKPDEDFKWVLCYVDHHSGLLGKCMCLIRQYYKIVRIVKGRPYHPLSQGSVEPGNASFSRSYDKVDDGPRNKDISWAKIGIFVINAKKIDVYQGQKIAKVPMRYIMVSKIPT
jgi:hypothetical protein